MIHFSFTSIRRQFHRLIAAAVLSAAVATPVLAAEPLVSAGWLEAHLKDANVAVLDIRSAVDGGGKDAYARGHIPGSVHSDYGKAGWRVPRNNVPFMLPPVVELEKLIGELGIGNDTHVVIVPAGVHATDFGAAARIYWTLKTAGIANVSILDGGFAAWQAGGLAVEQGARAPSPKIFTATYNKKLGAEDDEVVALQQNGKATLIDARPEAFFLGKQKVPAAASYGHIPGAINLDSASFYDAAANRLKPRAVLASIASGIPEGPSVAYCNTGHWAATDWFVLHELLGRKDVRLYDGSMVEWTSHAERPVASSPTK